MIQSRVHPAMLPHNTLEFVIETLPSGIILLDTEHRIVFANAMGRAYLARLTHSTVGDLLTQLGHYSLPALLAPTAIDDLPSKLINEGLPPASYEFSVRVLPALADRSRWMLVLHETTEQDATARGLRQQLVQHNTDRRRLQKQLGVSKRKLYKLGGPMLLAKHAAPPPIPRDPAPAGTQEEMSALRMVNAQLARAVRLKDEFWGNMSHELRTPLSAILLNGELLQRNLFGTLTPKQTQYVQRMIDSTNHLLALINDILDLTRIDAGYVELVLSTGDIRQFCLASIEMIKEQAQQKRIQVAFVWDEQAASVQVDELRFKQILVNLLTNAVKFTPERGKIGLKVTADPATNAVYFAVWDTGIGIGEGDLPLLFQRFIKLGTGPFPHAHSTGLGLALVVQLTKLHGGNIDVSSTPGSGSCFTVGIPWTPPTPAEASPELSTTSPFVARPASFVHQLSDAAHALAAVFVEQNISWMIDRPATDPAQQVQQLAPDLIFFDLTLDDGPGWRSLPIFIQAAKQQGIPLIVLNDFNAFTYAKALGADGYLGKPLTREHIQAALSTLLPQGTLLRNALLILPATAGEPLARILVIDDVSRTGAALADYLFALGYDVAIATTAITALALAQKLKPNLVCMDLQMPGMDSAAMVQQLRALPNLYDLPVIALTALTLPGDRERLWAAGINGYLSKPLHLGKLLSTIERLLPKTGNR